MRFLALIFLLPLMAFSQTYPAYTISVCDTSSKGYYFLVPQKVGPGSSTFSPIHSILDKKGKLVYYKYFSGATNDFKVQPNGKISYSRQSKFFIMDSTFQVIDSVSPKNGIAFDGHDLQILANGHFLLLGSETVTMNLSSYNYFSGNNSAGSSSAAVKCGVIQEQDQNKNVVFEWHARNYYNFSEVDPGWLSSPTNVDWNHCNAVELDNDGNFLLSVRHFNEITKIRRSDSTIIWRLGGNANMFTFTNDAQKFIGQHDIRRIANGNITLFDDGESGNPIHPARAKEYQLNEQSLSASLVWSYTENSNLFSSALGNCQRLTNGTTLVNYGWYRGSDILLNLINTSAQKTFEIRFADSLRSYRSFNYSSLPWDLKRPAITCTTIGNQFYLVAGSGQASYLWSNGATTQSILVSTTGTFNVWVPKGQGGFICSETFTVADLQNPCSFTALLENSNSNEFLVYPSPFSGEIFINNNEAKPETIFLSNVFGEIIYVSPRECSLSVIDTRSLPAGVYFLTYGKKRRKLVKAD